MSMIDTAAQASSSPAPSQPARGARLWRRVAIGALAFLTLVDLFAAQAILPPLAHRYGVSASAMGVALNASTFGMAIASLIVALWAGRIPRRLCTAASLLLLSLPTALLAHAPDLATFAALRVAQGLGMATAFALTLAHFSSPARAADAAAASAAYITGNVASNLIGRLLSAGLADQFGLAPSFYVFAVLNVAGAALAFWVLGGGTDEAASTPIRTTGRFDRRLTAVCAIGFCILFAFIGTFTYVNFVLMRPPFSLGQMDVGLVYFVFLPSLLTTPFADRLVLRFGRARTLWAGLGIAVAGLPFLVIGQLPAVLAGLGLVAVGTFLAQATATGVVGRLESIDRAAASGLYLGSYFLGGLAGAAVLGRLFDRLGWSATVLAIAITLCVAAALVRVAVDR